MIGIGDVSASTDIARVRAAATHKHEEQSSNQSGVSRQAGESTGSRCTGIGGHRRLGGGQEVAVQAAANKLRARGCVRGCQSAGLPSHRHRNAAVVSRRPVKRPASMLTRAAGRASAPKVDSVVSAKHSSSSAMSTGPVAAAGPADGEEKSAPMADGSIVLAQVGGGQ